MNHLQPHTQPTAKTPIALILLFTALAIIAILSAGARNAGAQTAPAATPAAPASKIPAAPTRFSVIIQGTGPDVILIPGMGSSRAVYDAEAKILAPHYRLHLVQINGFAGAPAGPNATGPLFNPIVDELHQYIVNQKLHPAVIGHSMGGLLTLMLAQQHPEDVTKILIVDSLPFYGLVFNPNATVEDMRPQAQAIHDGLISLPADQFAAAQPAMVNMMVKNPEGVKAVMTADIASDRTVFANSLQEDLTTDIRPLLPTIKTPATLLYPYDPAAMPIPEAAVTALYTNAYKSMPNLTIKEVKDSRHFIMYDQPTIFDTAVQSFLATK